MQRAARKVAQENERLRSLLARHGILKEEVDIFLRSCEQTDGSAEPEIPTSSVRSPIIPNPYPIHAGPRSLSIQPLSQAYSRGYSPRPSPLSSRPPVQISRLPIQAGSETSDCSSAMQCGPTTNTSTDVQAENTIIARPVEAYNASPSEMDSSPPPRSQEGMPVSTFPKRTPAVTKSQGCCPPQRPITVEDLDCPSTEDCFCPPSIIAPPPVDRSVVGPNEMSCETAATIIAQMRGDGDEAAARASLGCAPGQACGIKNAFLMQVLDDR
jgi:hypothetical protein